MVQQEKTFKEQVSEIRTFLANRRKLSDLAKEIGVSVRTVQKALEVEDQSKLTGKKIDVFNRAKSMKREIEEDLGITG